MSTHLGEVITYRVVVRPGQTTGYYCPLFGGPSYDIHYARRLWRRAGRQGADPSATGLLDLTELRKLAGMVP